MRGQIVKILSNQYTVNANGILYECNARGKFRLDKLTPLVGDFVAFDDKNNYILDIDERINSLIRPAVCNITQAFIVTSLKDPDFSTNLLDKLITIMEYNCVKPVICVTKKDLCNNNTFKETKKVLKYYKKLGYVVIYNFDIGKIKKLLKNNTSVFTGQSGAGKSTLLNKLNPNLNLETNEISKALGRGKHTTRHTELIELCGGKVLDTPGFSATSFKEIDNDKLKDLFIEFKKYPCFYKDCKHVDEKECNVKKNVLNGKILKSRYENYLKILKS